MVVNKARGAHYKHSFTTFACSGLNYNSFHNLMLDDAKWLSESVIHGVILQLVP